MSGFSELSLAKRVATSSKMHFVAAGFFILLFAVLSSYKIENQKAKFDEKMETWGKGFKRAVYDSNVAEIDNIVRLISDENISYVGVTKGSKVIYSYPNEDSQGNCSTFTSGVIKQNIKTMGSYKACLDVPNILLGVFKEPLLLFLVCLILSWVGVSMVSVLGRYRRDVRDSIEKLRNWSSSPEKSLEGELDIKDQTISEIVGIFNDGLNSRLESQKLEAELEFAKLVAHDINSPLTSVEQLLLEVNNSPDISPQIAILARALSRDMNGFKKKIERIKTGNIEGVEKSEATQSGFSPLYIPNEVYEVVNSKKAEFYGMGKDDLSVDYKIESLSGFFSKVDQERFRINLSNLINNSMEAIENVSKDGKITVSCEIQGGKAVISVIDSGPGVPEDLAEFACARGASSKSDGNGLGLYHCKKDVEEDWNGDFSIGRDSEKQVTIAKMTLPLSEPPNWYRHDLLSLEYENIVVLDDDSMVIQFYKNLFEKSDIKERVIYFTEGNEARDHLRKLNEQNEDFFFISDYQLTGQETNGLEIIENLDIARKSVLVTTSFGESKIQEKVAGLGTTMKPKFELIQGAFG